jgi:hypothetical protein
VSLPPFIFKPDAIAADLSCLTDNTFLAQLNIRSADVLPVKPEKTQQTYENHASLFLNGSTNLSTSRSKPNNHVVTGRDDVFGIHRTFFT